MKVYYGEETTNNILKEFKKLHSDYVHSLSYDDIERLANILPWDKIYMYTNNFSCTEILINKLFYYTLLQFYNS